MKEVTEALDLPTDEPKAVQSQVAVDTTSEQTDRLRSLLDNELTVLEQAMRQFQNHAASIQTDAGYEVKRAADYFVADTKTGLQNVIEEMQSPDYQPDEFAAAVMDGDFPDEPLIGYGGPDEGVSTKAGLEQPQADAVIEVTAGPIIPRSETRKARKA